MRSCAAHPRLAPASSSRTVAARAAAAPACAAAPPPPTTPRRRHPQQPPQQPQQQRLGRVALSLAAAAAISLSPPPAVADSAGVVLGAGACAATQCTRADVDRRAPPVPRAWQSCSAATAQAATRAAVTWWSLRRRFAATVRDAPQPRRPPPRRLRVASRGRARARAPSLPHAVASRGGPPTAALERNGLTDAGAVRAIIYGGKRKMPGYGEECTPRGACTFGPRLSDDQIAALADFVLVRTRAQACDTPSSAEPTDSVTAHAHARARRRKLLPDGRSSRPPGPPHATTQQTKQCCGDAPCVRPPNRGPCAPTRTAAPPPLSTASRRPAPRSLSAPRRRRTPPAAADAAGAPTAAHAQSATPRRRATRRRRPRVRRTRAHHDALQLLQRRL